jgi:glutamate/tyrosine decarboxylase-like PLP-dependent enzyme
VTSDEELRLSKATEEDSDKVPSTAFIDPNRSNLSAIRDLLTTVVDMVVKSLADATRRDVEPSWRSFKDFGAIPEHPLPLPEILDRVSFLLNQSRNLAHPGYMANMEPMPSTMAIVTSLVMAVTKNNMLGEEMSPFLTTVEPEVVEWFACQFGLGSGASGTLLAGGSLAILEALTIARNAKLGVFVDGIWNRPRRPLIFTSEVAHSSVQKAAMVMGLGTSAVIPVHADSNSRMDVSDLRQKVRKAIYSVRDEPFCVVTTAGTTITGNIDPLNDVAQVAQEFGLWLHTDASYGGSLIFSSRLAGRLKGIERSDSISWNLHKWFYASFASSLLMLRDRSHLESHFRIAAPYMPQRAGANLGEYSLQGSRQADVLTLILSLQHMGRSGFGALVESRLELAERLRGQFENGGQTEFSGEIDTNILCFRPKGEVRDSLVLALQHHLISEAQINLTAPSYRDRRWLKSVILNPYTTASDVDRLVHAFNAFCWSSRS